MHIKQGGVNMDYIKYEKTYVMLEEENHSFANDEKDKLTGVIKIETGSGKGAIKAEINNILYSSIYAYKLIFFGRKKEKTIYTVVGDITVDQMGAGRGYFRFNPQNADGKGSRLSDYSIAVIAAVSLDDGNKPLKPVARGSFAGETPVRPMRTQKKTYSSYYREFLAESCSKIADNSAFYEDIRPFANNVLDCIWKKIVNTARMPVLSAEAAGLCSRYRHFIFAEADNYYYIGVPGRKLRTEQPEQGRSGFSLWQPVAGAEDITDEKEAYGYWICAVNKNNGEIEEI